MIFKQAIEDTYFKKYFQSKDIIDVQVKKNIGSYFVNTDISPDVDTIDAVNPDDAALERGDDYDLF